MQWMWRQRTGELLQKIDEGLFSDVLARGYSGFGIGKNDPSKQSQKDIGPIPRGVYVIGAATDDPTEITLPLTPAPENNMYGRTGFLIHGDAKKAPGWASVGCIVVNKDIRQKIAESGIEELIVVDQ